MYIRNDEFVAQPEAPLTEEATQQYMQQPMQQYDQQYMQQPMQQGQPTSYQSYPMPSCPMGVSCPFAQTCPLIKGNISMPSSVEEFQGGMMARPYDDDDYYDDHDYKKYHHKYHHPYYHPYHHPYYPYYPPYFTPYNVFPWILGGLFEGHRY